MILYEYDNEYIMHEFLTNIYYLHLCVVNFACTYGCRVTLVKSLMPISSIQSNYATMQIMQTTNGITVNNFLCLNKFII